MSPEEPTGGKQSTPIATRAHSLWDVLTVAVALTALIVLTVFLVRHYGGDATNAATILGIVVPAFATIGAAAFWISVAYSAGQAKGEAAGQTQATQATGKAVADARNEIAEKLIPSLQGAQAAIGRLHGLVEQHAYSPPGERTMILGLRRMAAAADIPSEGAAVRLESQPVELDPEFFDEARRQLDQLQGVVEGLRS